jgi:hypothetical protein
MNQASFSIRKSKLKIELGKISKAIKGISNKKYAPVLEITITDSLMTLVIPGIKLEIPCKTNSTVKATLNFNYFSDIVKTWKDLIIECTITDNQMQFGVTKITVQTTFFENDSILRSIKLPINYTDYHLLQLEQRGFTIEELQFNKIEYEIYCAKRRLTRNINKTIDLLGIYGVTKNEIRELIQGKIDL